MEKLNWKWDGIWCSAGDPKVWTTSSTSMSKAQPNEVLPSFISPDAQVDWQDFGDESVSELADGFEATVEGYHLIIYNA